MKLVVLALAAGTAYAECPNACSGHGSCGAFDECVCFPNWQEADCSGRTCPFAAAHVDTPKGDLDGSADALSGPSQNVVSGSMVYPHGTTEQYPYMADSAGTQLTNTGHAYAECGNKGICDRGSGECECFPGYAGAGCQKATCADPTCCGHGICMNAQNLAAQDHDNVYNLWDAEVGFSCLCEPGYSGPTCASKMCKYGIDPLYYDDDVMAVRAPTARVSFSVGNLTGSVREISPSPKTFLEGTYAIKFYDAFGEDYETAPLAVGAKCDEVVAALEGMANNVVPKHGVSCTMAGYTTTAQPEQGKKTGGSGLQTVAYDLVFEENPGDLKPIEVNAYLDGERPTVYLADGNSTDQEFNVDIDVFPNWKGISGEFVDYFPSICHGVQIQVAKTPKEERTLGAAFTDSNNGLSADEEKLLKACLGDADGNADNNVEVYNWDYGTPNSTTTPHIVKLAPTDDSKSGMYDAGTFNLVWYGNANGDQSLGTDKFYFSGLPTSDTSKKFAVFPTSGTATVLATGFAHSSIPNMEHPAGGFDPANSTAVTARFSRGTTTVYTSYDTSCPEAGIDHGNKEININACLSKGDKVFLFNNRVDADGNTGYGDEDIGTAGDETPGLTDAEVEQSATAGNMYEVVKVGVNPMSANTATTEDRYYFVVDKVINWNGAATAARSTSRDANDRTATGNGQDPFEQIWMSHLNLPSVGVTMAQKVGLQMIVKFDTSGAESYEYVAQCSGRGLCNEGNCECFAGYTGDNCNLQSALAS